MTDERDSDASLWLAASSGTERAFVVIFDRYRSRVFTASFRRTNNVSDAEEIVAIVFLEAWRMRKRVRIVDGSVLPWLLAITANITSNLSRSQRRYARMIARLPPPTEQDDHTAFTDDRLDGRPCRQAIDEAINTLSAGDRAVVELCLIEELPLAAAAAALDLPLGTVKSRLHRARKQLQSRLAVSDLPDDLFTTKTAEEVA